MRALRARFGLRQEAIADAARRWGLPGWTQATVAAVELGQRNLAVAEFLMLPVVFRAAVADPGCGRLSLIDFVPHSDESAPLIWPIVRMVLNGTLPAIDTPAIMSPGPGQAERKAAKKWALTADLIFSWALDAWGHGIAKERDKRIGSRARTLDARSLQAVRGRVTRELLRELRVSA